MQSSFVVAALMCGYDVDVPAEAAAARADHRVWDHAERIDAVVLDLETAA